MPITAQSKLALTIAGALTLVLALAGLFGLQAQALEEFRLAHGWVPAQCATSFAIAGLSMLALAFGQPRLTQLGGAAVLVLMAALVLEQQGLIDLGLARVLVWSLGLSPYVLRISSHSALCFGVLGLTLLVMGSPRPFAKRGFVLAILSAFILALPVAEVLGFVLNLEAGDEGLFSVMAFTGPAHLLVGWAVLVFAWYDLPPTQRERLPWPPLLLVVGVLVSALLLWQALRAEEDARLRAHVATESREIARELAAGLERDVESLTRLAARWADTDTTPARQVAAALLDTLDGLERLESVRRDNGVVWRVGQSGQPWVYTAAQMQRREALLWNVRARGEPTLSEAVEEPEGARILIAIPTGSQTDAAAPVLLASYRLRPLLGQFLNDPHFDGLGVTVFAEQVPVYQRGDAEPGAWTHETTVNLYSREWRVRVSPGYPVIAAGHSRLPATVLFAGLLLTLALVWVHYLAQKAVLQARDLRAQIGRREQAESALQEANQALEQRVAERTQALHRSAEALAHEKELLAVTLDSIADGVITTDTSGRVLAMNKVAQELSGWREEAAAGQPLDSVFPLVDENGAAIDNRVPALLRGEAINTLPRSAMLVTHGGERRFVAEAVAPIRDRRGRILGAVLVFRDVSAVRKLEDELFRAKNLESIGLLAGGIAHDFNNIMTGILGNVSVAKLYTKPEDPAYENLVEAEKGFARARDLTLQLLTFSRGGAPIRKTASVAELLQDTTTFMLRGSNIEHRITVPTDLWPASIDSGQISQALSNLLINAKQAMPDGGMLSVRAENLHLGPGDKPVPPGNYVKITLQDTGVGIAPEDLPRVFDPYFTTKDVGTGLGLSTTYAIIRRHQGHIEVGSAPGAGTTFRIYLPAAREARKAPRPKTEKTDLRGHGRVLLMDDEEPVRTVAARMLAALGYEAVVAANGEEAIDLFNANLDAFRPFDTVIVDLTVKGGLGGLETLRRLRQRDPGARVIASSGYSNDPIMADHAKFGFDAVVSKPYRLEELSRALQRADFQS